MQNIQGPLSSSRQNFIHLNGSRNSYSARKNQPLKIMLDGILTKDYSDWKGNMANFDVLKSETARNTQAINQYVKNIYEEYDIRDPLSGGNRKSHDTQFSFNQYSNAYQKSRESMMQRNSKVNHENNLSHAKQQRNLFETPVKQIKKDRKGLQVVNISKQKQQKPQENVFNYTYQKISPNKVKFIERTAPSHDSSYALQNSRNRAFSSSIMNKSMLSADQRNQVLLNSRFSRYSRLPDHNLQNGYISSNKVIRTQNQLLIIPQFNSTRQFLNRKPHYRPSRNEKQVSQFQIGSYQSLGSNNPQRQSERKKNQLYASAFTKPIHHQLHVTSPGTSQLVKQSFRYCVGCQAAILQANIQFHEQSCSAFKEIFSLSNIDDILGQLQTKIQKIIQKINQKQQSLNSDDKETVVKSSRRLITEVVDCRQKSNKERKNFSPTKSKTFKEDYDQVMNVGRNWGLMTEEVNKLKWFLLVKDRFEEIKAEVVDK